MTTTITRADLREVLGRWQRQELSHTLVHEWATARYAVPGFTCDDEVTNEILAALDMLDMNLTTEAEVPYLLDALDSTDADRASSILTSMPLDREALRLRYSDDPVYGPFLR